MSPTFTPTTILRKETDLIRLLPPPQTPSQPIPGTRPPRPGSLRLGDANAEFSAQQRMTRHLARGVARPLPERAPRCLHGAAPRAPQRPADGEGEGSARAFGAARGERHWKAAAGGQARAGPRRSSRPRPEPAGTCEARVLGSAKQCAARGGALLARGGGDAPSPPEPAPLTSPRTDGPSAAHPARGGRAQPRGGAAPPSPLPPPPTAAAEDADGPRRRLAARARRDGAAAGRAGQAGRRAAAPGARAGRRRGARARLVQDPERPHQAAHERVHGVVAT